MLNRGETREDHGNAKCTGQQRREDKTGGHYALPKTQLRRGVSFGSQSTIFRAGVIDATGAKKVNFAPGAH